MIVETSAMVLAAGKSERMGNPKFALMFKNQKTFLEEIIDRFSEFVCKEIIIVMNLEGKAVFDNLKIKLSANARIVINPHPGHGRFSSIKTGLDHLSNRTAVFIHNVDNPFVNVGLLKALSTDLGHADYCVPMLKNRGGHPVLISPKVVDAIIKCSRDDLNLKEYLKAFEKKNVKTNDSGILVNVNTIGEYRGLFPEV